MHRLFRKFGLTRVFEQTAPDPNNPNLSGGIDNKGKSGGGGDDKGKEDPNKGQMYELSIGGEKRSVTLDEMRNLAMKAAGAEQRFEEASKIRKEAEDGIRLNTLITRLSDSDHEPTQEEIRELSAKLGVDPTEFTEYLKAMDDTTPTNDKGKPKDTPVKIDKQTLIEALGFDPAEAKSILDFAHQNHIKQAKEEIRQISDGSVDKDEIFGKMIVGENDKDRLNTIKDMVAEDVLRRIQDGNPFGAELVAASVQKIRTYLTKFGIPGKPGTNPLTMGLAPSDGLPLEVQSDKPIERISAAKDDGEDNFVRRAMQKGLQMLRNQPRR